jgi:two-component sensor histidine kinase
VAPARRHDALSERDGVTSATPGGAGLALTSMNNTLSESTGDDLRALIHRLNNQLGVILAHAELLEAKAPDAGQRARATQVVSAALQAMSLAREIRLSMADAK